jgi:hypothetical protein
MPHDLPPWAEVYQQARRWLAAGRFEALLDDLCEALGRSAVSGDLSPFFNSSDRDVCFA